MKTPWDFFQSSRTKIKNTWKIAFLSAFVLGILIHLPVMLSDIPNHDGLSSMYFDQNMITSGRWFLSVACGFSSYFTIPWIIGLIGLLWLALTAVALTELLELADPLVIMAVSGLLVSFPALASTFAYVFTMDGYMMALFLAILAVLFTKKQKKAVSYTHLRAHETGRNLVCRLLLEKKKISEPKRQAEISYAVLCLKKKKT